jgi:hypothetical protein
MKIVNALSDSRKTYPDKRKAATFSGLIENDQTYLIASKVFPSGHLFMDGF